MVILDDMGNVVTDPDLSIGYIEEKTIECTHTWIVDSPAEYKEVVVAEYDNGGIDVEFELVTPEEGHWLTTDNNNEPIPFDRPYFEDWKDRPVPDFWTHGVYHEYTKEQLAEIEKQQAEYDEAMEKQQLLYNAIEALPEYEEDTDNALFDLCETCDSYFVVTDEALFDLVEYIQSLEDRLSALEDNNG